MRTVHRADWVLPITTPPIRDGVVVVEDGIVTGVGAGGGSVGGDGVVSLGHAAVLPGIVNAHTHLELSWMEGRVPPAASLPEWAGALMAARRAAGDDPAAMGPAIDAMRASGTALVGDVGNTLASVDALGASPLYAVVFHEVLGFRREGGRRAVAAAIERARARVATGSARVRVSLAAHAPYSTAPEAFEAIATMWPRGRGPISVHVAESPEEIEFLQTGGGRWRHLLEDLGAWDGSWVPPACGPREYLRRLGILRPDLLVVHGVHLAGPELRGLAADGATVVTCPRSNAWTGAGTPPIEDFYAAGVRVAIGTDSLASVPDVNMFEELAAVRRLAPGVPAAALLGSATIEGARALGWADAFGSIEPGKRGELIAIAVDPGTRDVEEDLVRGISPDRVRWL